MTIFLSYSWSNEKSADRIEFTFSSLGIDVKRDKRVVGYKMNLKEYMQSIRDCDFSFLLISDEYLKSPACMYEICQIMKEQDFIDRVLPLILPNAKIYKPEIQFEYIRYWKEKVEDLKSQIETIGLTHAIALTQKLKEYEEVYANIGDFLAKLVERNVPSFESIETDGFQQIKDYIGIEDDLQNQIIEITASTMSVEQMEIKVNNLQETYPNRFETFIAYGHLSFVNEKYEKAIHDYQKAISLNDEFGPAHYNLGCMYQLREEFDKAESAYLRAIELTPENHKIYTNLSIVQERQNKNELAEENYKKGIDLNPYDDTHYFNYGMFLARNGRFDGAISIFEKCLEQNPENIDCLNNFGEILINEIKEESRGINLIENALLIDKYNSDSLLILAKYYEGVNSVEEAKKFYESYLAINREDISEHESYLLFLHKHFNDDKKTMSNLLGYINLLKDRNNK